MLCWDRKHGEKLRRGRMAAAWNWTSCWWWFLTLHREPDDCRCIHGGCERKEAREEMQRSTARNFLSVVWHLDLERENHMPSYWQHAWLCACPTAPKSLEGLCQTALPHNCLSTCLGSSGQASPSASIRDFIYFFIKKILFFDCVGSSLLWAGFL